MSTLASPRPATSPLIRLTLVEARLFLRQPATALTIFALPVVLTIGFGLIPSFGDPSKDLGGQTGIEYIAAISIAIIFAVMGLNLLPSILADNREKGILRRLRATPVRPQFLLAAQLIIYVVAAIIGSVLVIAVGNLAFDVPLPEQFAGFVLVFALGMASLLSLGLFVAAVAPSAQAATGIGMGLFFPSMFLAGVYFPRDQMPSALQTVSDCTPLGAALQALRDTWMGDTPRPLHLVIMAAYTVVALLAATRFFRWE